MTSCLVRSTPERVVLVRALARDIVLYSQQDALLSQCLSPSTRLYKWVPAKLMLGVTLRWTSTRGSRNTPCRYRNQNRLSLDKQLACMQTFLTYQPTYLPTYLSTSLFMFVTPAWGKKYRYSCSWCVFLKWCLVTRDLGMTTE